MARQQWQQHAACSPRVLSRNTRTSLLWSALEEETASALHSGFYSHDLRETLVSVPPSGRVHNVRSSRGSPAHFFFTYLLSSFPWALVVQIIRFNGLKRTNYVIRNLLPVVRFLMSSWTEISCSKCFFNLVLRWHYFPNKYNNKSIIINETNE